MDWLLFFILIIAVIILWKVFGPVSTAAVIVGGAAKRSNLKIKDLKKYPRSRSEAEAISHLEQLTGKKFPTVNPKWLKWKGKTLELDGYNEAAGIAIEFSGPLHTKWAPSREPYIDYFNRIVRDVVKRRLCKKHKVRLIVLDCSLPARHWRDYIASRLYDLSYRDNRPPHYIPEQTIVPYRNDQIEAEMDLLPEMRRAEKI